MLIIVGNVLYKYWRGFKGRIWNWLKQFIGMTTWIPYSAITPSDYSTIDVGETYQPSMMLMDAGIAFNSPYPTVLYQPRNVDIILSFDFSNRHKDENLPFKELRKAAAWAKEKLVHFPDIDPQLEKCEKEWTDGKRQEVYVFQGPPTIVHFVLINKSYRNTGDPNCDFDIFHRYGTFRFSYSNEDFDRLNNLVQHNIKSNKDKIIECIMEHLNNQKRKRESNIKPNE